MKKSKGGKDQDSNGLGSDCFEANHDKAIDLTGARDSLRSHWGVAEMVESIDFRFDGKLSAVQEMDFYESGRFQYGASRLMVKLDQYRQSGRFSKKITSANKTQILLRPHSAGSFLIETIIPIAIVARDAFIQAPIGLLWSYVTDRVFKPASQDNMRAALATQGRLLDIWEREIASRDDEAAATLALLATEQAERRELSVENKQLYERLIAEAERRGYLEANAELLRQISAEDDTKLVSMAAPLLKDMGVALRTSADTLNISAQIAGQRRSLAYVDQDMAKSVETSIIDDKPTLLLVDIIQYNKETGWGKLRMQEVAGLVSFNVPADRKADLQGELLDAMDRNQTYIECYFVRSIRGLIQQAIILSIRDLDEIEGLI